MAIKEELEIFISKNGELRVVAKGYEGNKCMDPLKTMQKVMGAEKADIHSHEEGRRIADSKVDAKVKQK